MITDSLDLLNIQWIFTDSYLRIIKSDGGYILVWYHFYMYSNICIQSVVKNLFTTSQYKICIKISHLNNFEWIYFKINYWILLNTTEYYWILLDITEYWILLNFSNHWIFKWEDYWIFSYCKFHWQYWLRVNLSFRVIFTASEYIYLAGRPTIN